LLLSSQKLYYQDLLQTKIGNDGEERAKAINYYVADATDLNDIYLKPEMKAFVKAVEKYFKEKL